MNVDQSATNGIQALKFTRPSTEPSIRIGVIAANTNWKYASDDVGNLKAGIPPLSSGMLARPVSCELPRIVPGMPMKVEKNPEPDPMGWPNAILNPHNTHTTSTMAN